jgi:FkbM family methyltransferase
MNPLYVLIICFIVITAIIIITSVFIIRDKYINTFILPNDPRFKNIKKDFLSRNNWEPKTNKILAEFALTCPPKSVIVDVGCHVGDTTFKLNNYLTIYNRKDIFIYAIDPNKDKIDFINRIISDNRIKNIKTFVSGISDKNGTAEEIKQGHSGSWKIKETSNSTIKIRTLDDICKDVNVGLVHLDVEGFEYKALLGMSEIIKRNHPIILLEFLHGKDKDNIPKFLKDNGYTEKWKGENNILYI